MKQRDIAALLIATVFVLASLIYGIISIGSPAKTRAISFDTKRISDLSTIKNSIDAKSYGGSSLPTQLSELSGSPVYGESLSFEDPETKVPYEYTIVSDRSYKLCATFSYSSDDAKGVSNSYFYTSYSNEFKHPAGRHCFTFMLPQSTIKRPTPTPKVSTLDPRISSVTSTATNVRYSVFPTGFFSEDDTQWGLINYDDTPVTVTVLFKDPQMIAGITNRFSYCAEFNCYEWSATGLTVEGETVQLVANTSKSQYESGDSMVSSVGIDDSRKYRQVMITVKRLNGDKYVHWKKLKFTYLVGPAKG